MIFEEEMKVYDKYVEALRDCYPMGGNVVIKGKEVLGVWHSRFDALEAGRKAYGDVDMLVKDINDKPITLASLGCAAGHAVEEIVRREYGGIR